MSRPSGSRKPRSRRLRNHPFLREFLLNMLLIPIVVVPTIIFLVINDEMKQAGFSFIADPWYRSPIVLVGAGIAFLAVVGFLVYQGRVSHREHRRFSKALREGTRQLAQVTMDLDETEIAASTLPTGSDYASELERRFAAFMKRYRELTVQQRRLEKIAAGAKTPSKVSARVARQAQDFAKQAKQLSQDDDVIIQAGSLYTRSPSWKQAWAAQVEPVIAQVDHLRELEADLTPGSRAHYQALVAWCGTLAPQLERIGTDLELQRIDVDTALDRVADLRTQFTRRLEDFARVQAQSTAESRREENLMNSELYRSRREETPGGGAPSILDSVMDWNRLWTVAGYRTAHARATASVDRDRKAE